MKRTNDKPSWIEDSLVYFSLASARNVLAKNLDKHIQTKDTDTAQAELIVLNQLQQSLRCPTFKNLQDYAEHKKQRWYILAQVEAV